MAATGWSRNGIDISKGNSAGPLRNVNVVDTNATANPGQTDLQAPSGNGISLQGVQGALVLRCNASGNGANSNYDFSPSMGWVSAWLSLAGQQHNRTSHACAWVGPALLAAWMIQAAAGLPSVQSSMAHHARYIVRPPDAAR